MALTKVSGSIIKDSVSLSGNVSVGGTLTYQDVTNVDAVGIVTARTGLKVLAGGANIVGVVTATQFKGDGSQLTGISAGVSLSNGADNRVITASSASAIQGEANLTFDGSDLSLTGTFDCSGESTFRDRIQLVDSAPEILLTKPSGGLDARILNDGSGNLIFGNGENSDTPQERLRITSGGHSYFQQSVGIQTNNIDAANLSNPVGAGHSLVGLYIGDGSLLFSDQLARSGGYYITTGVNALNAGPVTLNSEMTLDGTWTIV